MELHGKLVLLTGITGTVGSALAHRLLAEGAQLRALIRRPEPPTEFAEATIEWVHGDITDAAAVQAAMADVQLVIHAAAYLGDDVGLAERTNVQGTQYLLDAAREIQPELFVHISTISAYDLYNGTEFDESSPLCPDPKTTYQATKTAAERAVWQASEAGLPVLVIRPCNILSLHGSSYWGPVAVQRMAAGAVKYHPDSTFPWITIESLVDLTLLAVRTPSAVGQAYTAIDGHVSNAAFWGRIAGWLGKEPELSTVLRHFHFPNAKARSLGWEPKVTYEEAMAQLEAYARAEGSPR